MRFHSQPIYAQTLRYYAQSTRATKADRLGAAVTAGYCCLAFSAPFAGAALVSKNAANDDRYAKLYAVSPLLSYTLEPQWLTDVSQTSSELPRLPSLLASRGLRWYEAHVMVKSRWKAMMSML